VKDANYARFIVRDHNGFALAGRHLMRPRAKVAVVWAWRLSARTVEDYLNGGHWNRRIGSGKAINGSSVTQTPQSLQPKV
jgi:hypothetical protein